MAEGIVEPGRQGLGSVRTLVHHISEVEYSLRATPSWRARRLSTFEPRSIKCRPPQSARPRELGNFWSTGSSQIFARAITSRQPLIRRHADGARQIVAGPLINFVMTRTNRSDVAESMTRGDETGERDERPHEHPSNRIATIIDPACRQQLPL